MPRVIAGSAKGRRLDTLSGDAVRPTTDRVKEAIFSVLMPHLEGAVVIDLCAGSGGLGIEALSRGAAHCTFVEKNAAAQRVLEKNLAQTGLADRATVLAGDVVATLPQLVNHQEWYVDLVLADPPYADSALIERIVSLVGKTRLLAHRGIFVLETSVELIAPQNVIGLALKQRKTYGTTAVHFFEACDPETSGEQSVSI